MKLILIFSFLFGSVFMIKEQAFLSSDKMMYEQALELSKVNNKLIMLKLTADNCKYCVKMDNEVFTDNEVNAFVSENFIPVTINVDKEEIPLEINQTITPTFVFINQEGKVVSKLPGSWNKKDFMDLLRNRI
ncbi:MAG: Unknown protein [uncultured Sulfurovum sp.]|uniref:Thioredoxin-like fold domain-containing protein n=1 Tax=uncultured Sulfurovum sp. TaxID=269237 RepID=A0A6S6TH66_9BACT|nr:MAG: Unknown protein [uncultured Sulfurovum sp.]